MNEFKVGDKVKITRTYQNHERGKIGIIDEIIRNWCWLQFSDAKKGIWLHDLELVNDSTIRIPDQEQITESKQTKECTCKSRDLFNVGCKCGAITPYQAKWGW